MKDVNTVSADGLTLVIPHTPAAPTAPRLAAVLDQILPATVQCITRVEELDKVRGSHLLFAIALDKGGMNVGLDEMKHYLALHPDLLEGCTAVMVVDGPDALFTKSVAREMVFRANRAGCAFISKPLIEATGDLYNFSLRAELLGTSLEAAYIYHASDLVKRLLKRDQGLAEVMTKEPPRLLAIAATNREEKANSVAFWRLVADRLSPDVDTQFRNLGKGQIFDCFGCSWQRCTKEGCPQTDVLKSEIYDELISADAVLLLAPNLNDAIGPDLAAFINRLTYLGNRQLLSEKLAYAIIVSGYSGGDLLARQILNALCLNKGFRLPPYFASLETANRPRDILIRDGVEMRAASFARHIRYTLTGRSRL